MTNLCSRVEQEILTKIRQKFSNRDAAMITKSIRIATNIHIPQVRTTKHTTRLPKVPWWNSSLSKHYYVKTKRFKYIPCLHNRITLKKTKPSSEGILGQQKNYTLRIIQKLKQGCLYQSNKIQCHNTYWFCKNCEPFWRWTCKVLFRQQLFTLFQ